MVPYKPLLNASGEASVHSPGEKRLRHHRLDLHQPQRSGIDCGVKVHQIVTSSVTAFTVVLKFPRTAFP